MDDSKLVNAIIIHIMYQRIIYFYVIYLLRKEIQLSDEFNILSKD